MGQCKPQRTDNLFLLYAQNPEIRQIKTFEKWKEEGKVVKTGSKGYNFIVGQEYEKDGVIQQEYSIQKAMTSARFAPNSRKRRSQNRWTS